MVFLSCYMVNMHHKMRYVEEEHTINSAYDLPPEREDSLPLNELFVVPMQSAVVSFAKLSRTQGSKNVPGQDPKLAFSVVSFSYYSMLQLDWMMVMRMMDLRLPVDWPGQ